MIERKAQYASTLCLLLCLILTPTVFGQALDLARSPAPPDPPTPLAGPGCVSSCVECGKIYASAGDGGLWRIDSGTGVAEFIGWSSTVMLDIAVSSDGYLFGSSSPFISTPIWRMSACDASDCFDGTIANQHNSLGGDFLSTEIFAAGPPLASFVSNAPYAYSAIGGTVGPGGGQWCGQPSGDVAVDPLSPTNVFITLAGCTAACPGGADMLARLNSTTGAATNVGCLLDPGGSDVDSVFGLTFDSSGGLVGATSPTGGNLLRIDKFTALAAPLPMIGGPSTITGLAAIACSQSACTPDLELPSIACGVVAGPCGVPPGPGGSSIVVDCGEKVCLYADASDNCGALNLTTTQLPIFGATSPSGSPVQSSYTESFETPGVYDISWEASDSQGNVVTCSTTVDVRCDGCTRLPPGATDWWPLDETSTTSGDRAGSAANDGTHVGLPVPLPGAVDGALCFNGGPELVGVPSHPEVQFPGSAYLGTAEDFTIDLWVQMPQGLGRQVLLDKRANEQQATLFGYMLFVENGYFGLHLADGSVSLAASCDPNPALSHCSEWIAPTAPVNDGLWHLVAVTVERFSSTGGTLWVDGVPVLNFDPTPRLGQLTNSVPLLFGQEQPAIGSGNFSGCLDEIEFFDRALSPAEIEALYRAGFEGKCKCDEDDLTKPCPIGQHEYDADGDDCADGCICDAAFLGTCPNCPATAGPCNATGFDCGANAILLDSNCDCIYDQCAICPPGTYPRDTNGDGCEDVCDCYKQIVIGTLVGVEIAWPQDPDVPFVDLVFGTISKLKSSRGDFSQATSGCLSNDNQAGFAVYQQTPPPGDGVWFLARPVTSAGFGTYDATPTSQEGRDPGIAASGRDCAP